MEALTTLHRAATARILLALGPAAALCGCDIVGVACTDELRFSVIVEVRDAATGSPAARGATGRSEHESGIRTEFLPSGDLHLDGNWNAEYPGMHRIIVRKPGHRTDTVHADVDAGPCHVKTETVQARIAPDPRAVPEHPDSFILEPDPGGRIRHPAGRVRRRATL